MSYVDKNELIFNEAESELSKGNFLPGFTWWLLFILLGSSTKWLFIHISIHHISNTAMWKAFWQVWVTPNIVIIWKEEGARKYCSHTRHHFSSYFPLVSSWCNFCTLDCLIILQTRSLFHHFQSDAIKNLIISLLENSGYYEIFCSL